MPEPEYDLFDKTELTVRGISLENVDLDHVAKVAADAFGMNRGDLLVTDVLGDHLVIDILKKGLDPHAIVGKKDELLRRLSALPGVNITDHASISSKGMLGWIALSTVEGKKILMKSERMAREIAKRMKKTALIFSTGAEVAGGQVMDTNAPAIRKRLHAASRHHLHAGGRGRRHRLQHSRCGVRRRLGDDPLPRESRAGVTTYRRGAADPAGRGGLLRDRLHRRERRADRARALRLADRHPAARAGRLAISMPPEADGTGVAPCFTLPR